MSKAKIKNLKKMVLDCLEKYPETRNSDIKLTNAIWYEYYPDVLFKINGQLSVRLLDIYLLPKQDCVKRWRAKFQNEKGLFPPTDPTVRRKRQVKEEDFRSTLGYNPEMRTV